MGTESNPSVPLDPSVPLNAATVIGTLSSEPESRELPSGATAVSFSVTVRLDGEKTTAVPVVWYDPPKRLSGWQVDDPVVVSGSVVRRFYRGAGGLGSSTELVVRQGDLLRRSGQATRLLDRELDRLRAARAVVSAD